MNAQQLLTFFAEHYDFQRANQYLADPEIRAFAKSWLTVELGQTLQQHHPNSNLTYTPRYTANDNYLHYQEKADQIEVCSKRQASYADFGIRQEHKSVWYEIFSMHEQQFRHARERQKMHMNMARVTTFQRYLQGDQICLLSVLWGAFDTQDAAMLAEFDHRSRCTYALDSQRTGSGQISRLCQIDKQANPRLILAAYMPK